MKKITILLITFLMLLTGCVNPEKNKEKTPKVEENNSTTENNNTDEDNTNDQNDNNDTSNDDESLQEPTGNLIGVENGKSTKGVVTFNWDDAAFNATIGKWDESLNDYQNFISYQKNEIISTPGKYQIILTTTKNDKKTIYTFTIIEDNEIDVKISDVKVIGNTYYLILDIEENKGNINIDEIIYETVYQYYQKMKLYIGNKTYYLSVTLNVAGVKVNTSNFVINESLESPGLKKIENNV